MEFEKLFGAMAIIAVVLYFAGSWMLYANSTYNIDVDNGTFSTMISPSVVQINTTLSSISLDAQNATRTPEGTGIASGINGLVQMGLTILKTPLVFFGLVPTTFNIAGNILQVDTFYKDLGIATILFSLALMVAYLFIIGFRRFYS